MTKAEREAVCLSIMHKAQHLHDRGMVAYYTSDTEVGGYHYQGFEDEAKELYEVLKAHFEK